MLCGRTPNATVPAHRPLQTDMLLSYLKSRIPDSMYLALFMAQTATPVRLGIFRVGLRPPQRQIQSGHPCLTYLAVKLAPGFIDVGVKSWFNAKVPPSASWRPILIGLQTNHMSNEFRTIEHRSPPNCVLRLALPRILEHRSAGSEIREHEQTVHRLRS